jgi:hypothetical protein
MRFDLGEKQKEMLESILETGDGRWLLNMGYDEQVLYRIRDIIDRESYDSFDKEVLNEIRSYWVDGYAMML